MRPWVLRVSHGFLLKKKKGLGGYTGQILNI
jgi:hypothetical protein